MNPLRANVNDNISKVVTREEIQKTIIEGLAHITKYHGDNFTIRDLLETVEKLDDKIHNDLELHIPIYNIYAMIRNKKLEKRKELLIDIVKMYEFAYDCNFDDLNLTGYVASHKFKYKFAKQEDKELTMEEILATKVNLNKFLDANFDRVYGAYLLGNKLGNKKVYVGFNETREYTVEEFLEIEKKAKEIAKEESENKDKKEEKNNKGRK